MLLADNEKLTFVEGSVRRSIGSALVEAAVARDSKGGIAARAQMVAEMGSVKLSADALMANDFVINGRQEQRYREGRLSVDAPLKIAHRRLAAHGDVRLIDRGGNDKLAQCIGPAIDQFQRFQPVDPGQLAAPAGQQRSAAGRSDGGRA